MSSHIFTRTGGGVEPIISKCSCGEQSPARPHHWMVSDWETGHMQEAQARLAARTRFPTLKASAAYYRKMSTEPSATPRDRELWSMLADEIETRLGSTQDQDTLF